MNHTPVPNDSKASIDLTNIEVISFDCYGTLIDWETGIHDALTPVLTNHGVNLDRDSLLTIHSELEPKIQSAKYIPYHQVLIEVVKGFAKRFDFQPTAAELVRLADSVGDWPAFPDSIEALKKLKRIRKLAIFSNIDNAMIHLSIKRLEVEFNWVITAQSARAYKPALSVFHHVFKATNLKRNQVLHVAQSIFHDIAPANELGIRSVWVNRRKGLTGTGATPPATATPNLEVSSLAELAEILTA